MEEHDDLLVDLAHIPSNDSRLPWLQFYLWLAKYNEKCQIGAALYSELSRKENWSEEIIRDF